MIFSRKGYWCRTVFMKKVNKQTAPLVINFHPDLPNLTHFFRDHQCIIHTSPHLKEALLNPPLKGYRHLPNLKDLLVRAGFGQAKETYTENNWCQQPRCKTCAHIKEGITFSSTTTDKVFRVKATADCCTKNVVYVIKCKKCATQYVGETENALRVRLTAHRLDINHQGTDRPVVIHLCQPDLSIHDLTIMVVKKIHKNDANYRQWKESHWMQMLCSLTPDGLNICL